jgi:5-methylcytosine-specific restriction endonuclease McrBC GTP-binding regulatory subunit McrB
MKILNDKLYPELRKFWRSYPTLKEISDFLPQRKYIILQGPPGTGKTYLARNVAEYLKKTRKKTGKISGYDIIQFHTSVSYEDFVEGLKPDTSSNQLIFKEFEGPLLKSIKKAEEIEDKNKGYLLIIDEINRGDLAKILGEAIFLFEPNEERTIKLKSGKEIKMPKNLYVIGTMNTADRTIAILDFAIRRRFAFIDVWPSGEELKKIISSEEISEEIRSMALNFYNQIENIFYEYATDEELHLQPGHTYFIAKNENELINKLRYEIIPLLREYLMEGRLSIAKNELIAFIEKIEENFNKNRQKNSLNER